MTKKELIDKVHNLEKQNDSLLKAIQRHRNILLDHWKSTGVREDEIPDYELNKVLWKELEIKNGLDVSTKIV